MADQDSTLIRTAPPVCVAHRGASGLEPENTLRAFEAAIRQGATWLELDVRLVHGRLLVIHDQTLDRTTDGAGNLADHPLEALRALDAGQGQRIPFLEEVLDLAAGRARLVIEVKDGQATAALVSVLRDAIAGGRWRPERLLISAFDDHVLERTRALEPAIPVALLADKGAGNEVLEAAARLGAEAVHISRWSARGRFVAAAHARGLAVGVYPVHRLWEYRLMHRLGVDSIFTDHPERALAWGARAPAP